MRPTNSHRLVMLLSCCLLLAGCVEANTRGDDSSTTTTSADGTQESGGDAAAPSELVPSIVVEVEPSVVAVRTDVGEGSGVVWDADGTIVTNHHVAGEAQQLEVVFADGQRVAAELIATDPLTDLAVLRAERDDLPPAEFATELPRVGELAIAMGNPLGFENTVTAGIVSGLHRSIPGSAPSTQSLVDLLQTDAAISPGNSGGALVGGDGRVMGINVAYLPPSGGAVSIGFAIPSATVVDVVEQLLEDGTVSHAFLGVQPASLTPQIAQRLGVEATSGVVVLGVVPDSPAAEAGVEPGDVITAVEGETVDSVEAFLAALRGNEAGDQVTIQVLRDGDEREVTATLTDRPTDGGS